MALTPSDLADLLSEQGYFVDYDTGEVNHYTHDIKEDKSLLILLAAVGKLDVQCHPYTHEEPTFYITDLTISDSSLQHDQCHQSRIDIQNGSMSSFSMAGGEPSSMDGWYV